MIAQLLFLLLLALSTPATGHEWYEWDCCSDRDCVPMAGGVYETAEGYCLPETRELIPYASPVVRKLWSPDGLFHRCHKPDGTTRCLYTPGRGL